MRLGQHDDLPGVVLAGPCPESDQMKLPEELQLAQFVVSVIRMVIDIVKLSRDKR